MSLFIKTSSITFILLQIFVLVGCLTDDNDDLAGTSQVGNTGKVVGAILDTNEVPVANLPVYLVSVDSHYISGDGVNSAKVSVQSDIVINKNVFSDTTDDKGGFSIDVSNSGVYNLVTGKGEYANKVYTSNIKVNENLDSKQLGDITIKSPGFIKIYVDSTDFTPGYIVVKGTLISQYISKPGYVAMEVPEGTLFLDLLDSSGNTIKQVTDWLPKSILIDKDKKSVAVYKAKIPFPNVKPPYKVGIPIIFNAPSKDIVDWEYRFSWGNDDYSNWTTDTEAAYSWKKAGTYSVKFQVRFLKEKLYVSPWSEGFKLIIEE